MKQVYILRGLPGSAKSTLADELAKASFYENRSVAIHTTDNYHMVNGRYQYDASKAGEYHKKNLLAFQKSCKSGIDTVICPNTNINKEQYQKYVDYAKLHDYRVTIIVMDEFRETVCGRRTEHKMPKELIYSMKQRFTIDNKYVFKD